MTQQVQETTEQQQQQRAPSYTKRVRFAPLVSCIKFKPYFSDNIPEDTGNDNTEESSDNHHVVHTSTLWYSKEDMNALANADVQAVVTQYWDTIKEKRLQEQAEKQQSNPQESPTTVTTKTLSPLSSSSLAVKEVVCGRGLEMYLPGQLMMRKQRRKAYFTALIQKRETLLTLYNASSDKETPCDDDKEQSDKQQYEVMERLRKFLMLKSQACKEEARALALQDAMEAQAIYLEITTKVESCRKVSSSSASEHFLKASSFDGMNSSVVSMTPPSMATMLNSSVLRAA